MIQMRVRSVNIVFEFAFFALTAVVFSIGSNSAAALFGACFLHELGHVAVLAGFGGRIGGVHFGGGGIRLLPNRNSSISAWREITVLLAGPLCNLLAFAIFRNGCFAFFNLMLGIFNLMPFSCLDGGAVILNFGDILGKTRLMTVMLKILSVIILAGTVAYTLCNSRANLFETVIVYYCIAEIIT